MDLSIVVCTWRRDADMLLHSVHTLSHQTEPPLEIIVVDTNTEAVYINANYNACLPYPLVRLIAAPRAPFNLSKGMNVGIKAARGEYVAATCMEILFSANTVEWIAARMHPNGYGQSACGVLPAGVPVGPLDTVHARWAELCAATREGRTRISPGAIMVATREWWHSIRGYDEVHYPVWENDVDNARQSGFSGLEQVQLGWDGCQLVHPEHPPLKEGFQTGGEWFFGTTDDQVRGRPRNPAGWGEG